MQFTTDLSQSECLERIINKRRIRFARNKIEKETIETYTEVEDNYFKIYISTRNCFSSQQYISRKGELYIAGTVNENEDGSSTVQYRIKPRLGVTIIVAVAVFSFLCIQICPAVVIFLIMSLIFLYLLAPDAAEERKKLHYYIKQLLEARDEQ